MKERSDQGLWWLPSQEDAAVAGTLIVRDDEFPKLELIGALSRMETLNEDFAPDIILGVAGGAYITLYRCRRSRSNIQMPGLHTEAYLAHVMLRGAHFADRNSIRFSKMQHNYDVLFEWAGLSGIAMDIQMTQEGHLERIGAAYTFPEVPTFNVDGAVVALRPRVDTGGGPRSPYFKIAQGVALEVVPDVPLSLESFLENYFHDIANFLALAVGGPVRTTGVFAELQPTTSDESDRQERIEIAFLSRGRHVKKERHRWDMLFTLGDLGNEAEQALCLWLRRADHLRPVYDLYFGTMFQERAYIHQRFLSLAQALESYHRRVYGGTHLSEENYAPVLASLLEVLEPSRHSIDRDARSAFRNKLMYLNEVSLRRRLKDLLGSRRELAALLIRNETRFIERVVNTRNYYTHYDDRAREGAVLEGNLSFLSDQMQFLLELCFLGELGLRNATASAIIQRHHRYQGLRQALSTFDPAP